MKTQQIVEKQYIGKRVRGGGWDSFDPNHRCAYRYYKSDPDDQYDHFGFRVVSSPSFVIKRKARK